MFGWPNWVYTIWAYAIMAILIPVVLPVRIYEWCSRKSITR